MSSRVRRRRQGGKDTPHSFLSADVADICGQGRESRKSTNPMRLYLPIEPQRTETLYPAMNFPTDRGPPPEFSKPTDDNRNQQRFNDTDGGGGGDDTGSTTASTTDREWLHICLQQQRQLTGKLRTHLEAAAPLVGGRRGRRGRGRGRERGRERGQPVSPTTLSWSHDSRSRRHRLPLS